MPDKNSSEWLGNLKFEEKVKLLELERQDCRYQDGLRWSRYRMVGFIELAFLAGAYGAGGALAKHTWPSVVLTIFGSFLVFLVTLIAMKDKRDTGGYMIRVKQIEKSLGYPEFETQRVLGMSASQTFNFILILLNIFNWLGVVPYFLFVAPA